MTEYLNTDNTMKDKYRLVDVLYGDEKKVDSKSSNLYKSANFNHKQSAICMDR